MTLSLSDECIVLNNRYRIQWEEAQNCHVLLYPEGLVRLSHSAHEILSRCREPITVQQLIDDLQEAFPNADTLADDVREFVQHALEQEWVRRAE